RMGITLILKKYVQKAAAITPALFPEKVTPHVLRHSKAMHLLQAGVNIVYIRDFLGHTSVSTTETYARADTKMKRKALEKVYVDIGKKPEDRCRITNAGLLEWLKQIK